MLRRMEHETHDHDRGLAFDVSTLMARRQALKLIAGAGLATMLVGCGSSSDDGTTSTTSAGSGSTSGSTSSSTPAAGSATTAIPEETAGPYPGDGSNGVNVLTESGIVRSDIRSSFGAASGVASGVPLRLQLTVLDAANGRPLEGAAVYLWHCDSAGRYSLYSDGASEENYLRGVQAADANGLVEFASIFPAAYSGRWPHVHFEVYPSLDEATVAGQPTTTSQLALPAEVCDAVYATAGYEQSVSNMAGSSLESDNVFSDGYDSQLAAVTGSVDAGYVATLAVPV
jgi:protocatechuate 3,4-dioxygenase beta subunit